MNSNKDVLKNIKSVAFVGTTRLFEIDNWERMIFSNNMFIFKMEDKDIKFKKSQILITYK